MILFLTVKIRVLKNPERHYNLTRFRVCRWCKILMKTILQINFQIKICNIFSLHRLMKINSLVDGLIISSF